MNYDFKELTHSGIQSLHPYIPGKSIEEVAKEQGLTDIIKLASNENVLGCSNLALEALKNLSIQDLSLYPTSTCHPFREQLANFLNLDKEMISLSNGSDLLICLLLICFALHRDKHVLTHDYAFVSYEIQAQTLGVDVIKTPVKNWEVDIDAMIEACNEKTAIIFLANPNNPTGILIKHQDIKKLIESIPKTTILVLDEAYYEYARAEYAENSIELLKKHPNLIIIRTFSKVYGLAGLRLGYAIANEQITKLIYSVQLPFAVNIAAMIAASSALKDQRFVEKTLLITKQGIQQMQLGFDKLNLNYLPSSTNFITVNCNKDSSSIFKKLQEHGIIARPLHQYKMNDYLRITIGTEEQNKKVLTTLTKIIN